MNPTNKTELAGRVAEVNLARRNTALRLLGDWARRHDLSVSGTVYVAWTRDRHPMRFTRTGAPHAKRSWRTHWISPALTEAKRTRPPASHRRRCGLENGYVGVDPDRLAGPRHPHLCAADLARLLGVKQATMANKGQLGLP